MTGWKKKVVGFFPAFPNLAETSRLVRTAEKYREMEGQAVFFSHGGVYEKLATDSGFSVHQVEPIYSDEEIAELMKYDHLEKFGDPFPDTWLIEHVLNEEKAYKDCQTALVVTGFNIPCVLSARKAGIPLIYIIPGTAMEPYFKAGLGTFPDTFENALTRLLPDRLKNWGTNISMQYSKVGTRAFNRVAKKFDLPLVKNSIGLWTGDYTLISDVKEVLDIPDKYDFEEKDYIGPLFGNLGLDLKPKIKAHLERPGPKIYFAMGSSGNPGLYLKILSALSNTQYNVVAAYTSIIEQEDLPQVGDNILLEKYVPAEIVNKMVDLAILHGGQGTFYTAAYSGRPVIGIPMQFEQQYNIDILVRNGSGIRLSKKYFRATDLLKAIEKILIHYDEYRKNAETLANRLPVVDGAQKGAERIKAILMESI